MSSDLNAFPNIHEFSEGYWIVDGVFVEPSEETDVPIVQDHVYALLQDNYYFANPSPILLRHNGAQYHFEIHPSESVRVDTVEMPFELTDDMDIDSPPSEEQFLMAKPDHAQMIYKMNGGTIEG